MTQYADETLVPREVSIRREQNLKLKIDQQKEMENRRISAPQNAWNQSVAASTDTKMRELLSQVRKSDVSLPPSLTMMNGTFIYNQK